MLNQGVGYIKTDGVSGVYKTKEINMLNKRGYDIAKRVFDFFSSLAVLLVLSVPMIIVGILIKIDSRGPVFFKQERLGKNGRPFTMYKFRSMCINAEKDGARWADVDDDRCTRLGRYLRKVRVDEWPQLINILKGDMSVVGPRPERACFYTEFEEYIEGFCQRLNVKPGLTGWAQINGGYDLKPEEKIAFDLEYIENRSFWGDIGIIFKTILVVLNKKGAR